MKMRLYTVVLAAVLFAFLAVGGWAAQKTDSAGNGKNSTAVTSDQSSNSVDGAKQTKSDTKNSSSKKVVKSAAPKKSFYEEEKQRREAKNSASVVKPQVSKQAQPVVKETAEEKSSFEKVAEASKPVEETKPVETVKSAEPAKPAEAAKPVETAAAPVANPQPAEKTTVSEPAKTAQTTAPVKEKRSRKRTPKAAASENKSAQASQTVQAPKSEASAQPAPAPQPAQAVPAPQSAQPAAASAPAVESSEDVKKPSVEDKPDLMKENSSPTQESANIRITAIEVVGNTQIPTDDILAVIRSKVGENVIEPRIRADQQAIFEMGYFTNVKIDTPYFAGGVKLVFRLTENPIVRKITILGNKIVPASKLTELIQTKEGKILNTKVLAADRAEIDYYYDESLGYQLKPTHTKEVNFTSDGELLLSIQEGMTVKGVDVKGSSLFPEDKLRAMVSLKKGDLLNTKQLKEDTTTISKFYEDEGYVLDTIRPQVDYKEGFVTIQVIEAVVEAIKIEISPVEGRSKARTKNYVVYRNIRVKEGEVLQQKKLKKDIERLNNLGYFAKVNVEPEPGSKPGNVVLVFKMTEQKTGLATIGVGYTGGGSSAVRSGITGAISYSEKNIAGTGQGAGFSWQRGANVDALSGNYTNPAINKNQDSISVGLYRNYYYELRQPIGETIDDKRYALYDDKRIGGNIIFGKKITDDFRGFLSFRHETIKISRSADSEYEPTGVSQGTLNVGGVGALYDTRNDVFDPTEGGYIDLATSFAGGVFGGTYDYQKYQLEMRKYIPIGKKNKSTIALRAWGGIIRGKLEDIPVTETFYVGGTDTIRGYSQNEFYGTRMVVLNAEYRFPIANIKFLKGAVFADAGNAWFPSDSRRRLYADGGAGLRIVFPTLGLGVIRLDYSSGEAGGRTSIGIGQTF
ncbi:MAG: BamA/TamA family outer membrane protein [Firmicutes bacterium]|nr:BamA/TamA family outer membrane protein [Bacillota bacterium]